jgi:hypothetical protein
MPRAPKLCLAATLLALALTSAATAQMPQLPVARLNSIFPCGAQQGTTVECVIAGQELKDATDLYFSHPGIKAERISDVKYKVNVPANVPVGQYDVRAVTPLGLSSFRAFVVGDFAEGIEQEASKTPQRFELPVVVSGKCDGQTDVDSFVFPAKRGQRVIVNCWAWRVDSQMDATISVLDPQGKQVAYNGDYYGKDPLIDFVAAEDGDYTVNVWDFLYSGGSDFFYRLQIGSLPHLDAAVPAALHPGEKTKITLYGRNLPGGQKLPSVSGAPDLESMTVEIEAPADPVLQKGIHGGEAVRPPQALLDGMDYRLRASDGSSNPIFIGFTSAPIVLEQEPNNDAKSAQSVTLPCEVSGVFATVGDRDVYTFQGKKGERYIAEIIGERQNGQVDPFLVARDEKGKRLTTVDDGGPNIGQLRFPTATRDARWDLAASADGLYSVEVRDLYYQQRGEMRFTYRLSMRQATPDFRLIAVPVSDVHPDSTVVSRGGKNWLDVLVSRQDGFDEPITVEATNLPEGVTCEPVVIGPGKTSTPLVFAASPTAPVGHAEIRIQGNAKQGEQEITRFARGGGVSWSTVNTPAISRMADSIVLSVREAVPYSVSAAIAKTTVKPGEKLPIAIKIERADDWKQDVQLAGFELPAGATVALATIAKGASDGKVELALAANAKPGQYTFMITAAGQVPRDYARERDPAKPHGANIRVVYPSNALTITIEPAEPVKK